VTTPAVRVQRLREETRKAVTGDIIDGSRWFLDTIHPQSAVFEVVAEDEGTIIVSGELQAAHIARWDPKAAEKVLDLLAFVFDRHHEALNYDGDQSPLGICDREPVGWPCAEYRAALSLLDTLDPEGAEHA
jgi:hypothetical protein